MKIQDAYSLPGNHIMPSQSTALIYWVSLTCVYMCVLVTQSCPTLCNSMDCSLSDSFVHGIFQASFLEWVVIPFSRDKILFYYKIYNTNYLFKFDYESLEGLMLKMKLQYFGHLMRRADSLEKTLMLGKIESRRRRG